MSNRVDLACEYAVLRALDTAGKKSRRVGGRANYRRDAIDGPAYLAHTRRQIASCSDDCDVLLHGAWDLLRIVLPADTADRIVTACNEYTRQLLINRRPCDATELARYVEVACETASSA